MANTWVKQGTLDASGRYKFTYTADKANSESNYMILETENTFVDKNIFVQAIVPAGSLTAGEGLVDLSDPVTPGLFGSVTSSIPSGKYIMIQGSGAVSVSASGWLAANSAASSNTATKYYPINSATFSTSGRAVVCDSAGYVAAGTEVQSFDAVTPSTSFTMSNSSTYFTTGSSSNNDITITPRYTVSAGYVSTTSNKNNGGIAYWKIRTTTMSITSTTITNNTVTRQAGASWGEGWISSGSITAATFSNTSTGSESYIDITNTEAAPVLKSGDFLYINAGYTDSVKISLAKLIPDSVSSVTSFVTSDKILTGYVAFDAEGNGITGSIQSLAANTYPTSSANTEIAAGKYLSGKQTILAVSTSGISAAYIKTGITVTVGDSTSASRIKNVDGTFSAANTVTSTTSGVTVSAANAASIREGYAAFLNGVQLDGTMPDATITSNASTLTATVNSTSQSGSNPFSIYTSSNTHGIDIVSGTGTAVMGTNKVFIQINSSGSVKCTSDPGGYIAKNATAAIESLTRYISMNYYTGDYQTP